LEIRQKAAGFPHFHRVGGGYHSPGGKKDEAETEFPLTDPGHFEHDDSTSVASLRS
jgi:hypothetical protein